MKAHVAFDDAGSIIAMHVVTDNDDADGKPRFRFAEKEGTHVATLDVPKEFEHLAPPDLHGALKVDVLAKMPLLIAETR